MEHNVFRLNQLILQYVTKRTYKFWPELSKPSPYLPPKKEDRTLPLLPYVPTQFPMLAVPPIKHKRAPQDMRGPEKIHNQLIYGQYGVIALGGGSLLSGHFDMIRSIVNRHLDKERFFAIWRVDPPWKAMGKKGLGKKKGGGKSKVHHYETPVKAGRIIVEVSGAGEFGEVFFYLNNICQLLPFDAMAISQEILDKLAKEKQDIADANINPYKYREIVCNNYGNVKSKLSRYDQLWGGEYE